MWSALGKYRGVVISIALFLLLDASVLTLNFYISFKIANDAVSVNLAGRQRMLSQRIVKSLYEIESAKLANDNEKLNKARQELQLAYSLFDNTLYAFEAGGGTTGANKEQVVLEPVKGEAGLLAITDAKEIWQPLSKHINAVLANNNTDQSLEAAITFAAANNLSLLKLMNDLTVHLEHTATQQAKTLRYIQSAGISLAILNFMIILFHFIGQLKRGDRKLEEARQETTEILNTVNEGLFLLDRELIVGKQHSARLSEMFGGKKVEGISFSELISDLVKTKDLETAERFVSLLFKPNIKSNLIKDLNPLSEVELSIPDKNGGYITRYLSFDFTRVDHGEILDTVLVTVTDVTRSVELAEALAQEKERSEQQMETLNSILHTEPSALKRFIQDAFDSWKRVNDTLRDQGKTQEAMRRKLKDMFVEVHNFKGDAAAMKLEKFAHMAHQFEDDIQRALDRHKIDGNDFLKLTVNLENLIYYTESVQEIGHKLASFSVVGNGDDNSGGLSDDSTLVEPTNTNSWKHLYSLAESVAIRESKQTQLVLTGLNETYLDDETRKLVNDAAIQFIRNAVVHSIEKPDARTKKGKTAIGRIDVRLSRLANGDTEFTVHDDGAGINYDRIREKAIESGRWQKEFIAKLDQRKLLSLIFEPGFSTADHIGEDAGRGIGMDVVKSRVNKANGRLKVSSRSGNDCQFTIVLPSKRPSSLAA